jgi:prepilin-type processing-associated H-X9-DG protein
MKSAIQKGKAKPPAMTLLEVLIVIATVAVLIAMILPTFSDGRPAPGPRCKMNEKQIALAATLYADDSKGRFPNLDSLQGNDGPAALSLLLDYKVQTNCFICPFVGRQREKDRPWYRARFIPELDRAFFQSNGNDYAYYDGLKTGGVTNVILADRFAWTNRSLLAAPLLNHSGGRINAGFVDGHVEPVRSDVVLGANLDPPWSCVQDPLRRP